uniref:Protein FAR1-RELATED SEQUENCE 5-like n=1 Tax=Nicotiana sylvestris TaxID=4096 RepID=A0A1U7XQ78_NICSY|nr:PREDICTED: protein FAR1-RELATED SEQUENCE 5-like [Nicotiana sylvestris]
MDNFGESKCEATAEEVLQNNFQGSIDREPALGLEFDDDESAFNFYNEYARRIGFSVHKEYVNINNKLGYVTSQKAYMFQGGFRGDDRRKYQAKIHEKRLEKDTKLILLLLANLLESTILLRNLNDVQTHEIDLVEDAGLFSKGTFDFMSFQAGGRANLGCTKLDHKNYLRTKRQKAMGQGEADSKMIIDYEIFGDVLSFDTTYQTNKEHRPLASFVGFNNHRKMIVFGGALMYDETSESFQ